MKVGSNMQVNFVNVVLRAYICKLFVSYNHDLFGHYFALLSLFRLTHPHINKANVYLYHNKCSLMDSNSTGI